MKKKYRMVSFVMTAVFVAWLTVQLSYFRKRAKEQMSHKFKLRLSPYQAGAVAVHSELLRNQRTADRSSIVRPYNNALPNPYLIAESINLTEYRHSMLTFLHNPKSGGTTLKDCLNLLSGQLGKERPLIITPKTRPMIEAKFMNGILKPEDHDVVVGGSSFGICESFSSRKCSYFTIVREPYARMVSHYFFCKNGGETGVPCKNVTLEEYAIVVGSVLFSQVSLRVACRCESENCEDLSQQPWKCKLDRSYSHLYRTTLNMTKISSLLRRNLERDFAVIGLTEEYETTLRILQSTFGLPFYDQCRELRQNSGTYGTTDKTYLDRSKEKARKKLMSSERVRAVLRPDLILYKKSKEIFRKQKERLLLM